MHCRRAFQQRCPRPRPCSVGRGASGPRAGRLLPAVATRSTTRRSTTTQAAGTGPRRAAAAAAADKKPPPEIIRSWIEDLDSRDARMNRRLYANFYDETGIHFTGVRRDKPSPAAALAAPGARRGATVALDPAAALLVREHSEVQHFASLDLRLFQITVRRRALLVLLITLSSLSLRYPHGMYHY